MSKRTHSALSFRPASLDDFYRYAKDLVKLLDEPLQRVQPLLAQAYGCENLHALQLKLGQPGTPGPYEKLTLKNEWLDEKKVQAVIARKERLIKLIESLKGVPSGGSLPSQYARAVDFGLFDPPAEHRAAAKRVFTIVDALSNRPPSKHSPSALHTGLNEYVRLIRGEDGRYSCMFTAKGAAIDGKLHDVFYGSEPALGAEVDLPNQRAVADELSREHPAFPWPMAYVIIGHGRALGQGGWMTPLTNKLVGFDWPEITDEFKAKVVADAKMLLPLVKDTIEAFIPFFANASPLADIPPYDDDDDEVMYDNRTWSELLFWGGMIALNAGERLYAVGLFKTLRKLPGFPAHHWVQNALSASILDHNEQEVAACFKDEKNKYSEPLRETWARLAMAACLSRFDRQRAAYHFAHALRESTRTLGAFNPQSPSIGGRESMAFDAVPVLVDEFLHRSQWYWEQYPDSLTFFEQLAQNPDVMRAVVAWHEATGPHPTGTRFNPELKPLAEKVEDTVLRAAGHSRDNAV